MLALDNASALSPNRPTGPSLPASSGGALKEPMPFDRGWTTRWIWPQALAATVVLSTVTAAAQTYYVAPSPSGSDANDCLSPSNSCATFQRAVDQCPRGGLCSILAAPGVYSQKTNVFWHK